jgi:hypothetical protein
MTSVPCILAGKRVRLMHPEAVAVGAERSCLAAALVALVNLGEYFDTATLARRLVHEVAVRAGELWYQRWGLVGNGQIAGETSDVVVLSFLARRHVGDCRKQSLHKEQQR